MLDYTYGLYFENTDERLKAKKLLEDNGFKVDNSASHVAICIEEADCKLGLETIFDTNDYKVKVTEDMINGLASYLFEIDYMDNDMIYDAYCDWLKREGYHL